MRSSLALPAVLLLIAPPLAWAQIPGLPTPAAEPAASPAVPTLEPETADSPRAAARAFLELSTRQGDYAGAARYLVLSAGEQRGPELARRLSAVLERHLDIDLDGVSPRSEGNLQDGLPDGVDRLGHVPDGQGGHAPVSLVRVQGAAGPQWAFSRQTVSRVDAWYDALPDRFVRELVPQPLQRYGPWQLMWWQWLALPLLGVLALVAGSSFGAITTRIIHRLLRRTPTNWDERLLAHTSPALTLLWTVAAAAALLP